MKKIALYFLMTLFLGFSSHGQINLVPNPSFEDTNHCPFFLGDLSPVNNWRSFGNSPDCFHACSSSALHIPNNAGFGYQYPRSGNSMVGIITYVWEQDPGWPNYREYIGTELLTPLVIGQKYFVSYFINNAGYIPGNQHIGSNKTGARFSTYLYDETVPTTPDNFSHVHTDSIVTDTLNWYKVSGSFVADSAYRYIIIGNFYDHVQTDTIIFGGLPFGGSVAYYYLDDVCVSTDSCFCEPCEVTSIAIPNVFTPNGDGINDDIDFSVFPFELKIYNRWGSEVYSTLEAEVWKGNDKKGNKLTEGVYFYRTDNNETGFIHLIR